MSGSPGAVSFLDSPYFHEISVFVRGANGRLYELSRTGFNWQCHDRGTPDDTLVAHDSDPSVTTYSDTNGLRRVHVFVKGDDG